MEGKFAIALSEKATGEAVREVSLKIKSVLPKLINYLLIFFTPHYHPAAILKAVNFTLKPQMVLGMQAPSLIFEDRIIEKGILACSLNKEELKLEEIFTKKDEPQDIEYSLRMSIKNFPKDKQFLFSFIPHHFSPFNYLRGVRLSLGKSFNILGAGYIKRYSSKNLQIINNTTDEGLINVLGAGLKINSLKIGGFLPLGKPFTIDRVMSKRSVIMEINHEPAINIYKNYLEEKFKTFRENRLFSLYPLRIKQENQTRLISVIDYLDDGSLTYLGEIKENSQAQFMLFHPPTLFESLKDNLEPVKEDNPGLIFIINPLIRKKILKDHAAEEIKLIKHNLGKDSKIIGIFSDYFLSPDKEKREITLEAANLLVTFWK